MALQVDSGGKVETVVASTHSESIDQARAAQITEGKFKAFFIRYFRFKKIPPHEHEHLFHEAIVHFLEGKTMVTSSMNVVRDFRRASIRSMRFVGLEVVADQESTHSPEKEYRKQNFWEDFEWLLATIPENQAKAFVLNVFDGCSHKDIAESMELTNPRASIQLVHRAKQCFRSEPRIQKYLMVFTILFLVAANIVSLHRSFTRSSPGQEIHAIQSVNSSHGIQSSQSTYVAKLSIGETAPKSALPASRIAPYGNA